MAAAHIAPAIVAALAVDPVRPRLEVYCVKSSHNAKVQGDRAVAGQAEARIVGLEARGIRMCVHACLIIIADEVIQSNYAVHDIINDDESGSDREEKKTTQEPGEPGSYEYKLPAKGQFVDEEIDSDDVRRIEQSDTSWSADCCL